MPRATIGKRQGTHDTTLIYRLPARLIHPVAVFWALVAGAAVGTGAAVGLVAAGVLSPGDDPLLFRAIITGATVLAALALYGTVYLPGVREMALRVQFDGARHTVTLWPPARRATISLAAETVLRFRLDEPDDDGPCTLLVDLAATPPLVLLMMNAPCADARADLPRLAALLNAELDYFRPTARRAPASEAAYEPPGRHVAD